MVELERHQARLERGLTVFQAETGLTCPAECGQCCERTKLTITDLEARAIWRAAGDRPGLVEQLRSAIAGAAPPDAEGCHRCPLHGLGGSLGCAVYSARPILCRLFGYQLLVHQRGAQFSTCRVLAEQRLPGLDDAAADRLQRAAIRCLGANPYEVLVVEQLDRKIGGDGRRRPVNEALARTSSRIELGGQDP